MRGAHGLISPRDPSQNLRGMNFSWPLLDQMTAQIQKKCRGDSQSDVA
jgi:hypothetical protein